MSGCITGGAILLGDDVNTDILQPSRFFSLSTERRVAGVLCGNAQGALDGAIVVAGRNFGVGSSRESVIRGIVESGVRAVVARSISRIFLRNAVNHGLPAFEGLERMDGLEQGDLVRIDPERGRFICEARGIERPVKPLDAYLAAILKAGGLRRYMERF